MADSPLASSLRTLTSYFVGDRTLGETLSRVLTLAREALPSADMIGITMIVEGRQRTAIFTDAEAPEIDQAQYDAGEGPCVCAFEERRPTCIEATSRPGQWMAFRRAAAAHGIGSTLSFPLLVDGTAVGAMNLYARPERAFSPDDGRAGWMFATQAAVVLANARVYWDAHELNARLGEAMQSRATIEQAKGMLMQAEGISADDAFDVLVHASQRENRKLREIAGRMVHDAVSRGGSWR